MFYLAKYNKYILLNNNLEEKYIENTFSNIE